VTPLEAQIADHRAAVDEFVAVARSIDAGTWKTPRAEGAWSPAQIAEHLAVLYEYNGAVIAGTAPSPIPRLLRPTVHWFVQMVFFKPTLKAGRFTRKGRAPSIFQPSASPPGSSEVTARLDAAVRTVERAVMSRPPAVRDSIAHPIFGTVATVDWLRLQTIHVHHHRAQLPG